jgi:hypothetical protein
MLTAFPHFEAAGGSKRRCKGRGLGAVQQCLQSLFCFAQFLGNVQKAISYAQQPDMGKDRVGVRSNGSRHHNHPLYPTAAA